jgi:hypothetical protein
MFYKPLHSRTASGFEVLPFIHVVMRTRIGDITGFQAILDGLNQKDFLLGKKEKSNREYVVTFVGNEVYAVKWRNMKVHFAATEGTHSVVQKYTFPQVFDIKEGPKESYELWGNEGYIHAWVMGPVMEILSGLSASQQQYPNIKHGRLRYFILVELQSDKHPPCGVLWRKSNPH